MTEVERNFVRKLGKKPELANRRVSQMRRAFPEALVVGYQPLIPSMDNDPKDRHVLAAAVKIGAALIVTANLKDFPNRALDVHDIEAVHPDDFLLDQLDLDPMTVLGCLIDQRDAYRAPSMDMAALMASLSVMVPKFANKALSLLKDSRIGLSDAPQPGERSMSKTDTPTTKLPPPLVAATEQQVLEAFFPGGSEPDRRAPLGAGYYWLMAIWNLREYREALRELSYQDSDWGDYQDVADSLDGWSLLQNVRPSDTNPDQIAYMLLISGADQPAMAFADHPLDDVKVISLVLSHDGLWRVWGLSDNYFPSAGRVLYGIDD